MMRIMIIALVLALCACDTRTGTEAPELSSLRGQWVVINYWAKWCKPCIKEIPELNALDSRFPSVAVLGVNYDGVTGEELAAQLQALEVAFPTLAHDPAPDLGVPRPVVLPTTFILDPSGQLVATLVGPQTLESLAHATGQNL